MYMSSQIVELKNTLVVDLPLLRLTQNQNSLTDAGSAWWVTVPLTLVLTTPVIISGDWKSQVFLLI